MKNISRIAALGLPLFLLSGCFNAPSLITEEYSRMEAERDDALLFETGDSREIEEAIDAINSGRREETHEWELPEPEGTLTFSNAKEELVLTLFDDGETIDEYFVYVELDLE
ncbi:hypothetical protein [Planococcus chinensis]|uniref:Lipoprotein n=1 Tax=Planococcus chinensis TaxID=272917 RepID=A0ABW4QCQ9_9BACL